MHELLVPICQGYDSYHLNTEIEIGGQDQLFNFQVAREIQEKRGMKPQIGILLPIINGTDGRKMSKSFDNCIYLGTEPNDMFGQIMSISDDVMNEWYPQLTDEVPLEKPMESKKLLAFDIVKQLHGEESAVYAKNHFESTIQNKELPERIALVESKTLLDAIIKIKEVSKTEARRLLSSGAVKRNDLKVVEDCDVVSDDIVKVGKRSYGRII